MSRRNKKRKRKTKSRLFFLLLWLFIIGLSLASSSYAWFTFNRLVEVNLMDVKVKAETGLSISADAIEWKAVLSTEDLEKAIETYPNNINQLPIELSPVSTVGNVSNGLLDMYLGKVTNDTQRPDIYNITATKTVEELSLFENSDKKYLAFDIFVKTSAATDLYLTTDSGATYKDTSSGIENAVRFAFVVEGNSLSEAPTGTIQNMKTNDNNNVYIWEPNYDTHSEHGISNAIDIYGLNIGTISDRIEYDGIKSEIFSTPKISINDANRINYPNLFDKVKISYATRTNFTNNIQIFSVKSGITKIRVYMWIEGQDVDCEDYASTGEISLNLQLSTNPA